MLEFLTLINFQKHYKRTIEFDPFVTVFTGRTDAGIVNFRIDNEKEICYACK